MSVKFSDFASSTLTNNIQIVGYDLVANANVQLPKSALDAVYSQGSALAGNLNGGTVGVGVTTYIGFGVGTTNTVEAQRRTVVSKGTITGFYLRTSGVMTGALVATVMKNGVATSMSFTVAAGSAAALYGTTSNQFTVVDGDGLSIRLAQATAVSVGIYSFGITIR